MGTIPLLRAVYFVFALPNYVTRKWLFGARRPLCPGVGVSALSLELNAFAVLDVGLRANQDQIIEEHDDRLFEGADESIIGAARSRFCVPL